MFDTSVIITSDIQSCCSVQSHITSRLLSSHRWHSSASVWW